MIFTIDFDQGDSIIGWLIPNNPDQASRIRVVLPGEHLIEVPATIVRQDLVDMGLHNNGMVGFKIDGGQIPNLVGEFELEIRDADTDILIYRRFNPAIHLAKKFAYFDFGIIPQRKIFNRIKTRFAMNYGNIGSYPFETIEFIIRINYSSSLLLSGRPSFMRHAGTLKEREFVLAALLRSPFEEMAERLLFLSLLARSNEPEKFELYTHGLQSLIPLAREFPFNDPSAMEKAIRQLTSEQRHLLRDPVTRTIACAPDETPKRNHVTQALDNFAGMDVVGTFDRFGDFKSMTADFLGLDVFGDVVPEKFPMVGIVADQLARLGTVQEMLENDLALYSFVEQALDAGLGAANAN